jgi:hypothetical protein
MTDIELKAEEWARDEMVRFEDQTFDGPRPNDYQRLIWAFLAGSKEGQREAWDACMAWMLNEAPNDAGMCREGSLMAFAHYLKRKEG